MRIKSFSQKYKWRWESGDYYENLTARISLVRIETSKKNSGVHFSWVTFNTSVSYYNGVALKVLILPLYESYPITLMKNKTMYVSVVSLLESSLIISEVLRVYLQIMKPTLKIANFWF